MPLFWLRFLIAGSAKEPARRFGITAMSKAGAIAQRYASVAKNGLADSRLAEAPAAKTSGAMRAVRLNGAASRMMMQTAITFVRTAGSQNAWVHCFREEKSMQNQMTFAAKTMQPIVGRRVRVRYRSSVLGEGVFWEGVVDESTQIHNIVADRLAKHTASDGRSRSEGMWRSEVVAD